MKGIQNEEGFTLIELVMVIIILGVLAAVAIPKFIDLSNEAKLAAEKGMVGGVRGGIAAFHANAIVQSRTTACGSQANTNASCWPVKLNPDPGAFPATNVAGLFVNVIEHGGTATSDNWSETAADVYQGPAGTTFTYTAGTGTFN